ncbi:ABC transporter ATP-binding protein [Candidatus Nanohalococcus occultus]|uniref:ABC transporter ATP-binding protein n=1 Tax=Candidatus Nanohalococcus occultus TaxID=2978047 RepID=UPI0039E0FDBF
MSKLEAKNVSKSFGKIEALKQAGITAEESEIIGILGPNGAGKSTLMKILTGRIERDSGEVQALGIDPGEKPLELKKRIGVLPEREDPPSFLTGTEYMEMISEVRDTGIDQDEWVERLNLEGKMGSLTRDLSKGERQKLMVVQAFFHEPELVFVDEPLINLDPLVQERVKELFKDYREDGGTIVLSTHVISLAEELCDRIIFLKDGEVIDVVEEMENLKERFLEEE